MSLIPKTKSTWIFEYYEAKFCLSTFNGACVGWSMLTISSGFVKGPIKLVLYPANTHQTMVIKNMYHLIFIIALFQFFLKNFSTFLISCFSPIVFFWAFLF
jgi:hypothetical protein